jgi:polysaccharide export outer membrane protein
MISVRRAFSALAEMSLFAVFATAAVAQPVVQPVPGSSPSPIAEVLPPLVPVAELPPPPPPPSFPSPSEYRINPGDELEVYVWGEERLQRSVRVLPDGTIAFPLVGQLAVQERLLKEVEDMISERLRSQYRGQVPQVTVSVKAPAGMQFSILGQVRQPGTHSPGRYINVLEALSLAGGPAEFANLDNIIIIRKSGKNTTPIRVRLGNLFRAGAASSIDYANLPKIQTGDTVIVP